MRATSPHFRPSPARRASAITLIEAIILMIILSVITMGTGSALQSLIRVPTANNRALVVSNLMVDKMERLKALGYTTLSTTANSSDTVTVDNVTYTRSWTITANPGGNYDVTFLQITVTIGTQSFTTAVCKQ